MKHRIDRRKLISDRVHRAAQLHAQQQRQTPKAAGAHVRMDLAYLEEAVGSLFECEPSDLSGFASWDQIARELHAQCGGNPIFIRSR